MAFLVAESSINFSSSSWKVVEQQTGSFYNSQAGARTINAGTTNSFAFTLTGGTTYEGYILQLRESNLISTMTFCFNFSGGTNIRCVTVNLSDLSGTTLSTQTGGYYYLKFATPYTTSGTSGYSYSISTTTGTVIMYNTNSINQFSGGLVQSTTATPASGDTLFILGAISGTSTPPYNTVTFDQTGSTPYAFVEVGGYGKMVLENVSGKNYQLPILTGGAIRVRNLVTSQNGILEFGNSTTRANSGSTLTITLSASTNIFNGIFVRGNSTFRMYGMQRTRYGRLGADVNSGATSITLQSAPTNWLSGDTLAFGSSIRSATPTVETKNITGTTVGTSVPIQALSAAKSGSTAQFTPVLNLTSNIKIYGQSTSLGYNIQTDLGSPTFDLDNVEMRYFGSATATDLVGVYLQGTSATTVQSITNSALYESSTTTPQAYISNTTTTSNVTFTGNSIYGLTTIADSIGVRLVASNTVSSPNFIITDNYGVGGASEIFTINDPRVTFRNNVVNGVAAGGMSFTWTYPYVYTAITSVITNNEVSNCATGPTITASPFSGTNFTVIKCNGNGLVIAGGTDIVVENSNSSGNTYNIGSNGPYFDCYIRNSSCGGMAGFVSTANVNFSSNIDGLYLENCNFSSSNVTGPHLRQQNAGGTLNYPSTSRNSFFGTGITLNGAVSSTSKGLQNFFTYQNYQQVKNSGLTSYYYGTTSIDSTIFDNISPSFKCQPSSAVFPLNVPAFYVAVRSGATKTISVKVRKSVVGDGAAYNGATQPYVWLPPNGNLGSQFTGITVMTASNAANGAWETLTYTTPVCNDDTVLQFWVFQIGTTGWVNWDTLRVY